LSSAALLAGLPKPLVDLYIELASEARMFSERDLRESGWEGEYPGETIPTGLSELVSSAAGSLRDHAWHPYRARLSVGHALGRLERERAVVEEGLGREGREAVDWDLV
jgi:hypothetical protein